MKQHTFNWLIYSIILLLLVSCKKKTQGIFDDFPPGNFDFECVIVKNGIPTNVTGEVSGPYLIGPTYYFRRRPIQGLNQLEVRIDGAVAFSRFEISEQNIRAAILDYDVNTDKLIINYNSGDTLAGSFKLNRK